ncbi:MAG: ATP-binding cassette domain-containing protein [Deltaproteobacteria bacterium]|jgi:lipoprotein-releasing system ATP-binding protein|nr:ATP-binding cassette domain-containing protein [Deltaproteobacteria bacterium]
MSTGFVVNNLTKNYEDGIRKIEVLKGVNLDLKKGEMVAIIGASGTGKSTLLHLLGALDRPSDGTLLYKGENVFDHTDLQLAEFRNKTIGFVFQFHHLLPEFTALENIIMPGMIAGQNKSKLLDQGKELLVKVGLEKRFDHKVGELSGGEQQRVALARAIIMKPALLLADEPTGNLDPKTGDKIFALIQEMSQDFDLTTVIVTHNHQLAKKMDRCLVLKEGKLEDADL